MTLPLPLIVRARGARLVFGILTALPLFLAAQTDDTFSRLPFSVYLEAECGEVGDNWTVVTGDSLTSDSSYIVVRSGGTVDTSLVTPPEDTPANLVTFTTSVQERDTFFLWGRVLAPSPNEDSYWVRVNGGEWRAWSSRLRSQDGQWVWRQVIGSPYLLEAGTVTIDITFRELNTRLDKLYLSSLRSSPQGIDAAVYNCDEMSDCERFPETCTDEYYIEAECGTSGSSWRYVKDTRVSNAGFFAGLQPSTETVPTGTDADLDRQLEYTVDLTSAGDYYLYTRLNTPNTGANSFYVQIDDQDWFEFSTETDGSELATDGFEWRQVNNGDTLSFNLDAGTHTIRVAKREAGTQLDKLFLGRTTAAAPTGFGKFQLNCMENALTPVRAPLDLQSTLGVFPNPTTNQLTVQFAAPEVMGRVQIQVVDLTGRVLSQQLADKQTDALQLDVEVSELPKGIYHLLVRSERGVATRPFVKQ